MLASTAIWAKAPNAPKRQPWHPGLFANDQYYIMGRFGTPLRIIDPHTGSISHVKYHHLLATALTPYL